MWSRVDAFWPSACARRRRRDGGDRLLARTKRGARAPLTHTQSRTQALLSPPLSITNARNPIRGAAKPGSGRPNHPSVDTLLLFKRENQNAPWPTQPHHPQHQHQEQQQQQEPPPWPAQQQHRNHNQKTTDRSPSASSGGTASRLGRGAPGRARATCAASAAAPTTAARRTAVSRAMTPPRCGARAGTPSTCSACSAGRSSSSTRATRAARSAARFGSFGRLEQDDKRKQIQM